MNLLEYTFSGKKVQYHLDASLTQLKSIVSDRKAIIITDENVHLHHGSKWNGYQTVIIPAGEQFKNQSTVDSIIAQLIEMEADRQSFIIGIGGGVVTDMAGFVASIYMRGIRFGFVPTTILAQVDASIGGKNGIDSGVYKNMIGIIRQPEFILFDYSLLETLPHEQWVNGFAEIIKHSCIKDLDMFELLERQSLDDFQRDRSLLASLIERNVIIKSEVVLNDEMENGDRKLLNFGHTIGHAIENLYQMPHGHAISIGMAAACAISVEMNNFSSDQESRILALLQHYHLPISGTFNMENVFRILKMDKKRTSAAINFILLNTIGEAVIRAIPLTLLEDLIVKYVNIP